MWRIRAFEERVGQLTRANEVHGLVHLSTGQEAVAVGVCSQLRNDDVVYSGHRAPGRAWYLRPADRARRRSPVATPSSATAEGAISPRLSALPRLRLRRVRHGHPGAGRDLVGGNTPYPGAGSSERNTPAS